MIITLTEQEMIEAVTSYIGSEYSINNSRFIAGRGGSGNRLELDVTKTAIKVDPLKAKEETLVVVEDDDDSVPFEVDEPKEVIKVGPVFAKLD